MRIFYDPHPDGTRSYDDRASFMKGELVGTYRAEEYFAIDPRSGTFSTRVNYTLLDSAPFTFKDHTVNLAELAPRMAELSTGHNPEPSLHHEPIPDEEPFTERGHGEFAAHFPVGGTLLSTEWENS